MSKERLKQAAVMVATYAAFSALVYWVFAVGFDQPM